MKQNTEDQKKPSPGNKVQKLKPPTPPRKARIASLDPTTAKDVLREFEFMVNGPQGEAIDFTNLGYLKAEDMESDQDNAAADNTTAPQYLTVQGTSRIMRYFKNFKTAMTDVSSVPSLRYNYRDHMVIFRVVNWDEGIQLIVIDPDNGKDASNTFALDQTGNQFLVWLDSAIDQMTGQGSDEAPIVPLTP